jgi:hypothetical protein
VQLPRSQSGFSGSWKLCPPVKNVVWGSLPTQWDRV